MRICLHTLLHTKNNHAVGRIDAGFILSVFSHNPLVVGSSPTRPTNTNFPQISQALLPRSDSSHVSRLKTFWEVEMKHLFSIVLGIFVAVIGVNGFSVVIDKFVQETRLVVSSAPSRN